MIVANSDPGEGLGVDCSTFPMVNIKGLFTIYRYRKCDRKIILIGGATRLIEVVDMAIDLSALSVCKNVTVVYLVYENGDRLLGKFKKGKRVRLNARYDSIKGMAASATTSVT